MRRTFPPWSRSYSFGYLFTIDWISAMALLARIIRPMATGVAQSTRSLSTQAARIVEHPNPLTTLAEDESFISEAVRSYAENEIQPKVGEMEASGKLDADVLSGLFAQGFMGVTVDAEHGGTQSSFAASCLVVEELARADAGVAAVCELHNTLVNTLVAAYGSGEQKQSLLPRLVSDTLGSVVALDEDVPGASLVAKKDGDGFVLQGQNAWCTHASGDILLVLAQHVDADDKHTLFAIDRSAGGVVMGETMNKLGMRVLESALVDFQGVRVGHEHVLGVAGEAGKYWHAARLRAAISGAAGMVGLARGVYDSTMPYLYQRVQFGTAIANFQGMQHQRAQVATEIEAARLHVYNAARLLDHGMDYGKAAMLAWNYSTRVARKSSSMAIEWLGGVGFTKDFPAEKYYRDSKPASRFPAISQDL